jgi:hypothetical protein
VEHIVHVTQAPLVYYAAINFGHKVFPFVVVVKNAFTTSQTILDILKVQLTTILLGLLLWHSRPATGLAGRTPALTCAFPIQSRCDFFLLSPPIWLTAYGVLCRPLLAKISRYHRHTYSPGRKAEVKTWYIF